MNIQHNSEMLKNISILCKNGILDKKNVFIFGHSNATEKMIDALLEYGCSVSGILDNNTNKQGKQYRGVGIVSPIEVLAIDYEFTVVLVASRAYSSMAKQLNEIGYKGKIVKLIDYNSFSEFSLSYDVVMEKKNRLERGLKELEVIKEKYQNKLLIMCPYAALGDVYYAMAYLPHWLKAQSVYEYVVFAVGYACCEVAKMFGVENVESITQKEMDELVQAILYSDDEKALIAHHDRPYTSELIKSLNHKCVLFERLYRSGVFGLDEGTGACEPKIFQKYDNAYDVEFGRTVILSPYAKSVASISDNVWNAIVDHYNALGYKLFTNVVGDEMPIKGTEALNVPLSMFQSLVEYAGTFIGVRSGLCDVIKSAKCIKIALYPNCYYSNTNWKVADFFKLEGWENIIV